MTPQVGFKVKKILLTLTVPFLIFTGCGYQVRIDYLKPVRASTPEQIRALENVYLVVRESAAASPPFRGKLGALLQEGLSPEIDLRGFAAEVQRPLAARGGRLCAYRVSRGGEDPFVTRLRPSSILEAEFAPLQFQETESREAQGSDEKKRIVSSWTVSGRLAMHVRLLSFPSEQILGETDVKAEKSARYETASGNASGERCAELTRKMLRELAEQALSGVTPVTLVTRYRPVYHENSDEAYRAFRHDAEPRAQAVWKERLAKDPNDWKVAMNLGMLAEKHRDFNEARHYYEQAHGASLRVKEASDIRWTDLWADLAQPLSLTDQTPDSAGGWFSQKLAVLPFSDYSTSIDGLVFIRKLTQASLEAGGYRMLRLDDVDRLLRDHGYSQGGQLKNVKPQDLAAWLQADGVLMGDLEKFNEVTLGVYGSKQISGSLRIYSSTGTLVWTAQATASTQSTASSFKGADIGWAFAQQLLGSWADKASKTPMSAECAGFVEHALETFPKRPPKEAPRR